MGIFQLNKYNIIFLINLLFNLNSKNYGKN